jgi:hypothetical protein
VVSFTQISSPKPCIRLSSPIRATCPAFLVLILSTLLLPLPLRSKYSPQTACSQTFSLLSSLNVSDQVSYPYKKNRKNLYFCVSWDLYIWKADWDTLSAPNDSKHPWLQSARCIFLIYIWLMMVVPKYLICSTPSKDLLSSFMWWHCHAIWSWDMTVYLFV